MARALFPYPADLRISALLPAPLGDHHAGVSWSFDTNVGARTLFAIAILLFEMVIGMPFLLYTGGLVIEVMFGVPLVWSILAIAVFVGVYTTVGGLGAVVWTDFVQATFMLVGGVVVTGLGLREIGGFDILMAQASEKMHVVLPAKSPGVSLFRRRPSEGISWLASTIGAKIRPSSNGRWARAPSGMPEWEPSRPVSSSSSNLSCWFFPE